MELLNKIYRLVQMGRCSSNIFFDDKFEQSKADRHVFRNFDGEQVEMVVFTHVDDILARAQATMERFAAELGEKFKVKSMVEKFGVEKARRTPASSEVPTLSPSGRAANSGGGKIYVEVPVPGGCGGAHMDGNDDTAGHCVRGARCGQVLEPWTGA